MKKILIVNPDLCIGCRMCEAICSLSHYGAIGISRARLKVLRYDSAAFFLPMVCTQCEDPYCASVCPSRAITKDPETGVVKVSRKKCAGCSTCVTACPFGAMGFADGVAIKCDHCSGSPYCAEFCQSKAITFGEPREISDAKRIALSDKIFEMYKDSLTYQSE